VRKHGEKQHPRDTALPTDLEGPRPVVITTGEEQYQEQVPESPKYIPIRLTKKGTRSLLGRDNPS